MVVSTYEKTRGNFQTIHTSPLPFTIIWSADLTSDLEFSLCPKITFVATYSYSITITDVLNIIFLPGFLTYFSALMWGCFLIVQLILLALISSHIVLLRCYPDSSTNDYSYPAGPDPKTLLTKVTDYQWTVQLTYFKIDIITSTLCRQIITNTKTRSFSCWLLPAT